MRIAVDTVLARMLELALVQHTNTSEHLRLKWRWLRASRVFRAGSRITYTRLTATFCAQSKRLAELLHCR